jgi:hypothetical protein
VFRALRSLPTLSQTEDKRGLATARACKRGLEALELLQEARRLAQYGAETSKLLIDVLFALGDRVSAVAVVEDDAGLLSDEDRRLALLALNTTSEPQP